MNFNFFNRLFVPSKDPKLLSLFYSYIIDAIFDQGNIVIKYLSRAFDDNDA